MNKKFSVTVEGNCLEYTSPFKKKLVVFGDTYEPKPTYLNRRKATPVEYHESTQHVIYRRDNAETLSMLHVSKFMDIYGIDIPLPDAQLPLQVNKAEEFLTLLDSITVLVDELRKCVKGGKVVA